MIHPHFVFAGECNRKVRYREAQEVLGQLEKNQCHVRGVVRNQSHIHGEGYYKKSAFYKIRKN